VGAGALRGTGLYNVCIVGRVVLGHWSSSTNAAFTLRPLYVARGLGRCDHDYPGGAGTTPLPGVLRLLVLGPPASLIRSELSHWAPILRFAPLLCRKASLR
jgi:hypothetical protein